MTREPGGEVVRCRVIYSGRVQGVCFRAAAQELSRGREVVGFIRNRHDGTVELEAEGPPAEVDSLLVAMAQEYAGYISREERTPLPAQGNESRFEIRL